MDKKTEKLELTPEQMSRVTGGLGEWEILDFVCPNCGSFQKTVLSGKDFTIREIVVPDERAES